MCKYVVFFFLLSILIYVSYIRSFTLSLCFLISISLFIYLPYHLLQCKQSTSSGKTTTVNAMIGRDLLPSGMGDTTCCFVLIDKVNDDGVDVGEETVVSQEPQAQQNPLTKLQRPRRTSDDDGRDDDNDEHCVNDGGDRNGDRRPNEETASYFVVHKVEIGEKEASLGSLENQRHPLEHDVSYQYSNVKF